jgi:hypothetical protein
MNGSPIPFPLSFTQPVGSLMLWPAGSYATGTIPAPAGYVPCDGFQYLVSVYPALYSVIGNTWGGTPGVNFRVPDCRGRAPMGAIDTFYQANLTVAYSFTLTGNGLVDSNSAWYVTATDVPVYEGMSFVFSVLGSRTIKKILAVNTDNFESAGRGDGWVCPFVILWSTNTNPLSSVTFPSVSGSVTIDADNTVPPNAPVIGTQFETYTSVDIARGRLGNPRIAQGLDQVGPHTHSANNGNINAQSGPGITRAEPGSVTTTSQPSGIYSYVSSATTYYVNNTMPTLPMNFGVYYFIKA